MEMKRLLARKGVLSGGVLGLNTLCRGCFSHTTLAGLLFPGGKKLEMILIGLLYPGGQKSETDCTSYKV